MATPMPPSAAAHRPWRRDAIRHTLIGLLALALATGALGVAADRSPVAAACGSFQDRVDAASAGSTITIPSGCTFKETVRIGKRLTINAHGVTVDGENTRTNGIIVAASDVTINGLTVKRVKTSAYGGAVWTNGVSRFTFRDGRALQSATICISLNGGSGHQILGSELADCGKEGYFANAVSDTRFAGNDIHHNNVARAFDPGWEAGGGKVISSQRVTFDGNQVHHNGGPGIWFDVNSSDAVVTGNRIHDNFREGVFFEVSRGATIASNAIWNNGFGFAEWGYGGGIVISSSDGANVNDNTVAWNARGISVISQSRGPLPHDGNLIRNNTIISNTTSFVTGFYDDHGGSLFASANGNGGSGNRYWVGGSEPSTNRFGWNGPKSRLSDYNATPGESGATYLSTAERDTALAAAGISGAVIAPVPAFTFRAGQVTSTSANPARINWAKTSGASAYQLHLRRFGGSWVSISLPSSTALGADVLLKNGVTYQARVRIKLASGAWSAWRYSAKVDMVRSSEASSKIAYGGSWKRVFRESAIGDYLRSSSTAGATATFTFTGRAVAWLAPRGPGYGKAEVFVDGALKKTVDLYRASSQARRVVFQWSWASSGPHTVKVRVLGTSGRPRVDIDGFGVLD